ncbi:MAG: FeoA family protein [Terracidiphilus sp.]
MRARRTKKEHISICCQKKHCRILNYDFSSRNLRVLPFQQPFGVRRVNALSELKVGSSGVLIALDLPESVQNHLMHMGFVPDARVRVLRRAPAGDPTVYGVDGMEIALRRETASAIRMRSAEDENELEPQLAAEAGKDQRLDENEEAAEISEAAR